MVSKGLTRTPKGGEAGRAAKAIFRIIFKAVFRGRLGERPSSRQLAQPVAETDDFRAIGGAFRRHQPVAGTRSRSERLTAITGVAAEATRDQDVDLALDQFMQAGGLQHPQAD